MPGDLELYAICDNYATHRTVAVKKWLLHHPRVPPALHAHQLVLTELVARWFAELTRCKLRRSAHRSVTELETVTSYCQRITTS